MEESPTQDMDGAFAQPGGGDPAGSRSRRGTSAGGPGRPGLIIAGIVLVIALIVAGLFLPPISLGQRLAGNDDPAPAATQQAAPEATTAGELSLDVGGAANVPVEKIDRAAFLDGSAAESWQAAAAAFPEQITLVSDVYALGHEGTAPAGRATLAIPAAVAAGNALDLYGWDGQKWSFVASELDGAAGQVTSLEAPLPRALALAQAGPPATVNVAAELLPLQELPAGVLPVLTELSAGTLTLVGPGELQGEAVSAPTGAYRQLLRTTNTGVVVDQLSLATLLSESSLQASHISELVDRATAGGFAGVNLDYQGVTPNHRQSFAQFVTTLAGALHDKGLMLAVTLETPLPQEDGRWDSAGHDWAAIGHAADVVYVQMPLNPTTYADGGAAEQLLAWAVRHVDRYKLTMVVTAAAVDGVGEAFREVPAEHALANFGAVALVEGGEQVEPGTPVEVGLSGSASAVTWDVPSLSYKYSYEEAGQAHSVWLGSEAALAHRLRLASRYNLRGVLVRGLSGLSDSYAAALESFASAAEAPQPAGAAIVWTIADEAGGVVASSSGEALAYRWDGSSQPGAYAIAAEFAQGEHVVPLGEVVVDVRAPEPTALPEPTAAPVAEAEPTAVPAAVDAPEVAAPVGASLDPGDSDAVVNSLANLRVGPGLGYGTIAGGASPGTKVSLTGRNSAADWLQVELPSGDAAWIFRNLLNVNPSVDVNSLAVVEVDPPAGGGGGGSAPPPAGVPPVALGSFELGGQTHSFANPQLMAYSGMNWVKFQHKWGPGDDPAGVAGRIQQAHANGFKVLLSIPGAAAYPSSIEFGAYIDFLGGVASYGPDAIEIWNEMNIDFEWPAGQIDPSSYVNNMLAPAYNRIKSVNPNVMVVSGAPAPTGYDNGTNAWADNRYMAGVAAAGGGNYMDCIGVHHNAGATSPYATSGHPAGGHYSWYFLATLNMYYNAFGGARRVCFTELGFLSGEDYGGVPSRFAWAANTTVGQHAQWLAEAASLSANSGQVRMMIIFNVDFTHFGDDPQAGYAMIRPNGSCPACEALHAATGGR